MKTSACGPEHSGNENGGAVTRTQDAESDGEETIPLYKAAMWLMDEVGEIGHVCAETNICVTKIINNFI